MPVISGIWFCYLCLFFFVFFALPWVSTSVSLFPDSLSFLSVPVCSLFQLSPVFFLLFLWSLSIYSLSIPLFFFFSPSCLCSVTSGSAMKGRRRWWGSLSSLYRSSAFLSFSVYIFFPSSFLLSFSGFYSKRMPHRYPGNKVTVIAGVMAMHRWASIFFSVG